MKLQLNTTEMLDWMELWCFRCEHDHGWSHPPNDENEDGCQLVARSIWDDDVTEFEPRHPQWWRHIPAEVSCSAFKLCSRCAPDPPDAERRGGETRREFHDRLRAETLAQPVFAGQEGAS